VYDNASLTGKKVQQLRSLPLYFGNVVIVEFQRCVKKVCNKDLVPNLK